MSAAKLKVINLGLPKSGTTTLGVALGHAGLKVADWRIRKGQSDNKDILGGFVGAHLYRGYYETGDPLALLSEFDAVTEMSVASKGLSIWPQTDWGLLAAIRAHHPGVKFTLSHRDPGALVKSMLGWSNLGRSRLPKQNIPGLPTGFGTTPEALERWINGHYAFCRRVFRDDPDFLEYDLLDAEAPQKLSEFLGLELPWWGKANVKDRDADEEGAGDVSTDTPAAPATLGQSAGKSARKTVFLHAGAHLAGTGAFQQCLDANRAVLAGAGYAMAFSPRDGIKTGNLDLKLPEPRTDDAERDRLITGATGEIARHFGVRDRLILSEENLPGRMMHFYDARFYPAAEVRARALASALNAEVAHLLFVVRDYQSFYIAAHRHRAARRAVPAFAEFSRAVMSISEGWPHLIDVFQKHLKPRHLTVVDYAGRGDSRALLAGLVPDVPEAALIEPETTAHPGATDAALMAVQAAFDAGGDVKRRQVQQILEAHRDDVRDLKFAEFAPDDARMLKERYARDLDHIAAMKGVTFQGLGDKV